MVKRRQVFADGRATLHDGERADAHELMHKTIARNERAIEYRHMAAQQRTIGDDDVVAQMGIMADMTIRHQEINASRWRSRRRASSRDAP